MIESNSESNDGANLPAVHPDLLVHRWLHWRTTAPSQPLNRAVYGCLRQAILDGALPASARLPASRDLAAALRVSRNTVTHAYEQLLTEGYLRALTGSGTFVADVLPEGLLWTTRHAPSHPPRNAAPAPTLALSHRGQTLVEQSRASASHWGAFVPGVPDVREFAHRKFEQIAHRLRRQAPPDWWSYATGGGHPALRQALAEHLRQSRSVQCHAEQIIITEGVHQAVDLLSRLLANPCDPVWVEEPGYWGLRSLLRMNDLQMRGIAVDGEGIAPSAQDWATPPKLIFVTPSHQYPLGAVMSLPRRLALLEQAQRHGSWIVEDDYDSEFRFSGHPIPSLQGLVPQAPVIYLGTFSKTAYPGLRVAYMVVPQPLAEAFRVAYPELYRQGQWPVQAALAEFIDKGHYAAHIRRMRLIYAQRRAALVSLVKQRLGPHWLHPCNGPAGLQIVLTLPPPLQDQDIKARAAQRGVVVRALSDYYSGTPCPQGLLLGFACLNESAMLAPFESLLQCLQEALHQARFKSA